MAIVNEEYKINAVKCEIIAGDTSTTCHHLSYSLIADHENKQHDAQTCIFIISQHNIDWLSHYNIISKLKVKHKKTGLTHYCNDENLQTVGVKANFVYYKKLLNSVKIVLEKAAGNNFIAKTIFIAIPADVFRALWLAGNKDKKLDFLQAKQLPVMPVNLLSKNKKSPQGADLPVELDRRVVTEGKKYKNIFPGHTVAASMGRAKLAVASIGDISLLLLGETGTGKSSIAQKIHANSKRKDQKFIQVNCTAVANGMFESEMFGHVKGAFTGATSDKKGYFEQAQGGTLFLDEIGDLPLDQQPKLLDALERGMIRPVGASKEIPIDVRIISATNIDLQDVMKSGDFRMDLYYRIAQINVKLPSIRENIGHFAQLAKKIWCSITEKPTAILSKSAIDSLYRHEWEGNVRELKSVLRLTYEMSGVTNPDPEHLMLALYSKE